MQNLAWRCNMIITMPDGSVMKMPVSNCTGYVAAKIELEAKDAIALHNMALDNPDGLCALLAQLANRFQANRAGNALDIGAEFEALNKLGKAFIALPPIVDDDYPEARYKYECALDGFLRAAKANGRVVL